MALTRVAHLGVGAHGGDRAGAEAAVSRLTPPTTETRAEGASE